MSSSNLLDEVHSLQDRYDGASRYERQVLDLAASLLELICEEETGSEPDRVTRMASDEFLAMPDRFELIEGRIRPKEWGYWEDLYNRRQSE